MPPATPLAGGTETHYTDAPQFRQLVKDLAAASLTLSEVQANLEASSAAQVRIAMACINAVLHLENSYESPAFPIDPDDEPMTPEADQARRHVLNAYHLRGALSHLAKLELA